ncbi:MAG TPA: hypothetical protein VET23_08870, partial [Chitinophagaceae bacterium]|nr:hypothetical protein [Chitinophagaceae bacterium]
MFLPSSLKIIIGLLIVLVILFFFLKQKRKFIWPLIVVVIGIGIWKSIYLYNQKNPDIVNVKADVKIAATELIGEYEKNDSLSNQKFLGKIIEVNGNIKKVEKEDTGDYIVVLGDT